MTLDIARILLIIISIVSSLLCNLYKFICRCNRCAQFGLNGITGKEVSFGREPDYFTPVADATNYAQDCLNCQPLSCPPSRPCKLGNECFEAEHNRKGISWCPRRRRHCWINNQVAECT